ncbi:MAG: copper resistance protein CopC, partial [Actinomycetota bacterium]|nr:copper resistance protein CopC [Actinomycetota bacterium]
GPYTAEWRITSVDGHVINDAFNFTVTNSDVSELPGDAGEPVSEASGGGVTRMAIIGLLGLSIAAALGVVLRRRR